MKNKIVSGVLGLFIGGVIVVGYSYIKDGDRNDKRPNRPNFNNDQLIEDNYNTGSIGDEIKTKFGSGESINDSIDVDNNLNNNNL